MKALLLIICIAAISCCGRKRITGTVAGENEAYIQDSSIPTCIQKLIRQFQEEEKQHPPRSIYSYRYTGKTVYFVPAICCDFFSDLYDDTCKLLGHPDGGYTGRGDGSAADFLQVRTREKLIWEDKRK